MYCINLKCKKVFCAFLTFVLTLSLTLPLGAVQAFAQSVDVQGELAQGENAAAKDVAQQKTAATQNTAAYQNAQAISTQESDFLASGDGSSENPYHIDNEEDLSAFASAVNGYSVSDGAWVATGEAANNFEDKKIVLDADITLTKAFTPIGIGKHSNASYVTVTPVSFKGIFDGQGHSIKNLYFDANSNPAFEITEKALMNNHNANCFSALFGCLEGATVLNLNINLAQEATFSNYGAGLAGIVRNGETKFSCVSVTGDVKSDSATSNTCAGLVGIYAPSNSSSSLNIEYCFHSGKVYNTASAGGFIGSLSKTGAAITSSYQFGDVSSSRTSNQDKFYGAFIGAGSAQSPTLDKCVTDQSTQLVGANITNAKITDCITGVIDTWNSDAVKAALGTDYYSYSDDGATPPTLKSTNAKASYSVTFEKGANDVSGAVPSMGKVEEESTFEIPTSNLTRRGYTFSGWKRTDVQSDVKLYKSGDVFTMPSCQVVFCAQWVEREVAQSFSTEEELRNFANAVNAGTIDTTGEIYKLTCDIELTKDWTPIGASGTKKYKFEGIFDGCGHTISGLNVTSASVVQDSDVKNTSAGLFGYIDGATIKNLGVSGNVSSDAYYSGGLVGNCGGSGQNGTKPEFISKIDNCFSRVKVSGLYYVGGLCGYVYRTQITNSYATGTVCATASDSVSAAANSASLNATTYESVAGGLIGCYQTLPDSFKTNSLKAVSNCYSSATVHAANNSNAHLGSLFGAITATYAAGDASRAWSYAENSFVLQSALPAFNVEVSDGNYSACASAVDATYKLSANALKAAVDGGASSANLGSSFMAESQDEALWINGGYPLLTWEQIPSAVNLELYICPSNAQFSLINNATGAKIEGTPVSSTSAAALYTFNLNNSTTYTLSASAYGYQDKTASIDAKNAGATLRQELKLDAITYSISYELSGGQFVDGYVPTKSFTITSGNINLPDASCLYRSGSRFEGWYIYPDYQGSALQSIDASSAQNYTLYAKWSAVGRTLSLDVGPQSAKVQVVRTDTGEEIAAQADGAYKLSYSLDYKVTISATGYQSTTFDIEAGSEDISKSIVLEKEATPSPDPDPSPTPAPDVKDTRLAAGKIFSIGSYSYIVQKNRQNVYVKAKNKKLKKVAILSSVKDKCGNSYKVVGVASCGFKNCKKLKKFSAGTNLQCISSKAFSGCKKLKTFTLPAKVKKISKNAFAKCKKLSKITVKSKKLNKSSFKNMLKKSNIKIVSCKKVGTKVKKKYKAWVKKINKKCKVK